MSLAWYMDDDRAVDQREEHHLNPKEFLTFEQVKERTGVIAFRVIWSSRNIN